MEDSSESEEKSVTEFRIQNKKSSPKDHEKSPIGFAEEFARKGQFSFKRERKEKNFQEPNKGSVTPQPKGQKTVGFASERDFPLSNNKKDNSLLNTSKTTDGSIHSQFLEKYNKVII